MRKIIYGIVILGVAAIATSLLVTGGYSSKARASYHFHRAKGYFDAGQYGAAAIEYQSALRRDPQAAGAWAGLGSIYFDEGRLLEAAPILFHAAELNTNNLAVRLKLGFCYLNLGMLKAAREAAEAVLKAKPQDDQAPVLLANSAGTNSDIAMVRRQLQRLQQPTDRAPLEIALGLLAFRESDLPTAETCFKRALELDPKSSDAHAAMGSLYTARKDVKHADEAFKTAAGLATVWSGAGARYAQFKILTGDGPAGEQMLGDIVKANPDYLPGWLALAQYKASQKQYTNALDLLNNVLRRDTQNLEGLQLAGRLQFLAGRKDKAVASFERAARCYPQLPSTRDQLARAYLANSQTNEASKTLSRTMSDFPKDADARLLWAEISLHNGNPAGAEATLKQLVQQQPELLPGWLLLANTYRAQAAPGSAVQIYRALEKQSPKNPQLPLLLGLALLQQGDNAGARSEFELALRLAPDLATALEQLVNLDLMEKKYSAAAQSVESSLKQNPQAAGLHLLMSRILAAQGETNAAEAELSKVVALEPDSPTPYLLLAQFNMTAGQFSKALTCLQEATKRDSGNTAAWMLSGVVYDTIQDYSHARDAYEKVLAITPDDSGALNNLACDYADHLGQLDRASSLAQRARDLAPQNPSIADTLGWILFRSGRAAAALPLLRESADRNGLTPVIQYHLGMAAYQLGDESQARSAFQSALRVSTGFSETNDCAQRLALLSLDPKNLGPGNRAQLEPWLAAHPDDPVALARMAAVYQAMGLPDKTAVTYEKLLQTTPRNVPALINYARWLMASDPKKALPLAKSAFELKPEYPDAAYVLGQLAFKTADYPWARRLLELAAQAQPQAPEVQFDYGNALYAVGQVPAARAAIGTALQTGRLSRADEARRFLQLTALADNLEDVAAVQTQLPQLLKSAPDYIPALMLKALLAQQQTNWMEVEQTDLAILKHYPDFAPAQRQLAWDYARDPGNDAKAYPLAEKAHQAFPRDQSLTRLLGILAYRQGNYAEAANLLQECVSAQPKDGELYYYFGLSQYRLKRNAACQANLKQALHLNLSGHEADEARRVLTALGTS